LTGDHVSIDALTANPRYKALNEQIFAARGEDIWLDIDGDERLRNSSDSIAPEAACTSVQCHLQVSPETFPAYWNAAQAIAGVQMAMGANSPFLFGRQLWRETRIALFDQASDTRSEELKEQGVRPRVWFGERWFTSVSDLFEENVRYFPALLPICSDEDPLQVLESGGVPSLAELRLHNGTVYRWNRPVYDVVGDLPHLRVDNRVLPAGPTVVDMLANAASWCCASCCQWPPKGCPAGESIPRCPTAYSGRGAALPDPPQRGGLAGGDRAHAGGRAEPEPAGRTAPDGARVHRAHAQQ
jgi:hypothetical protein